MQSFLSALKDARQDKLWNQNELAWKMGVTPLVAWEWEERGRVPTADQCRRLAKLLGLAPPIEPSPGDEWRVVR